MTINQLILFLEIYRGTNDRMLKMGTTLHDRDFLVRQKLLLKGEDVMTKRGIDMVNAILILTPENDTLLNIKMR